MLFAIFLFFVVLVTVMGKSQSRLGFKSRFEHFLGVIQQFKEFDSATDDWDSIRFVIFAIRFGP